MKTKLKKERHSLTSIKEQMGTFALKYPQLERVWVFGSWARGDYSPSSDYDLAFEWKKKTSRDKWLQFKYLLIDELKTLHQVDLIFLNDTSKELRAAILKEGILIYEKNR